MGWTVAAYRGTHRIARSTVALLCVLGCLCGLSSCVGTEQKRVVLSWSEAFEDALDPQEHAPPTLMSSATLVNRLGGPDQRVPAALLEKTLPAGWGSDAIRMAVEARGRQLSSSGQDESVAADQVGDAEFWLYDESARYRYPSQPDSFWGMGTGFQVVWFAVYKDQVIATSGFGLGNGRRLQEQ